MRNKKLPLVDLPRSNIPFFISILQEEPHQWTTAYRPNYQKILWIRNGKGKHFIDDTLIDILPHSFYFINKGNVYQLYEDSQLEGILIRYSNEFLPPSAQNFNDHFYSSLYGYILDVGYFQLNQKEEINTYEVLLRQLIQEFEQPPSTFGKRNILQHILLTLLLKLERKSRKIITNKTAATEKKHKEVYTHFVDLVEQHFFREHQVTFYAKQLGLSPRRLSEINRLFVGHPAKVQIQRRILTEAKRLLVYTNNNLKDIAYQLGFDTPTYFSRFFKKHTKMTPLEYQKEKIIAYRKK